MTVIEFSIVEICGDFLATSLPNTSIRGMHYNYGLAVWFVAFFSFLFFSQGLYVVQAGLELGM